MVVFYTAVFCFVVVVVVVVVVVIVFRGALLDDTKNGCEGDCKIL